MTSSISTSPSTPREFGFDGGSCLFIPRASDRSAWQNRLDRLPPAMLQSLESFVSQAKAYEIKPVLASHYRTYMSTGDRLKFEDVLQPRRANLLYLAVGAGILGDENCLGPLEDLIWSTCEETTWVTPPVTRGLPSHRASTFEVELTPAMTGLLLASIDYLFEDQLDPLVRQRVNEALLARVIRPFLDDDYWWLNPPPGRRLNNWTAVCSAGALACATLVPELHAYRKAIIDKCSVPLTRFLETFDEQGGCEEGGSYWVFGVDYLTLAAELMLMAPDGVDLYSHPRFKAVAQFLPHIFMGDKHWMTFSDCRQIPRVNPSTLAKLDDRLNVPQTGDLARRCDIDLAFFAKEATLLHTLAWWPQNHGASSQTLPPEHGPEACRYFSGLQWMISRTDPQDCDTLILSAHAGHNGYSHNHNDVGHVSVYSKTLPLLVDLGVPVYDRDYFSPKRVTYLVASSLSHNVPQINGQLQLRGEAYASKVLRQQHGSQRDEMVMDLKGAYGDEAGLASLVRHVSLQRTTPATAPTMAPTDDSSTHTFREGLVEVADEYRFKNNTPDHWAFVSTVFTTGRVTELAPGKMLIRNGPAAGLFTFDSSIVTYEIESYPDVVLREGNVDCTRICLSPREPVREGSLQWQIRPVNVADDEPDTCRPLMGK